MQIRLLDDQIDHLDDVVLVRNQPLDGIKGDGTLPHLQTLPGAMTRRKGRRGLLLLVPDGWAHPLFGWTIVLGIVLPLRRFSTPLRGHR